MGWRLHPGLLALHWAIGLQFASRHKPSGTWRKCTYTPFKQLCCLTHVGLAGGERENNLAIALHGTRALLKLAHC